MTFSDRRAARLGSAHQVRVFVMRLDLHAIRSFLTADTQWSPRHRGEPLLADVLITVEANPEAAIRDPLQGGSDFTHPGGIAIDRSHGKIPFLSELNSIEFVRRGFDGECFA